MNIAFEITNQLLHAGYIIEDLAPTKVQTLVESVLQKEPRLRTAIIHLQDKWYPDEPMAVCHQVGNSLVIADDSTIVTCRRCLRRFAMHKTDGKT